MRAERRDRARAPLHGPILSPRSCSSRRGRARRRRGAPLGAHGAGLTPEMAVFFEAPRARRAGLGRAPGGTRP